MIKLLPLLFLLTGCLNNDGGEVSSGGGQRVDPEIMPAFQLVADTWDFSGIKRIYFADTDGAWMRYMHGGFIKVNRDYFDQYSDRENACALVHELAHHNGGDEEQATKAWYECKVII